jgi:YcxB-like protein
VESSIHLAFRYSEQDIVRALRTHIASRLRLKLDIVMVLVLALFGVYTWRSLDSPVYGMVLVGVCAVFVLVVIVAFGVIPAVIFRREAKFRDEYSLTFSSEGIHFRTVHIDSQLQWSMYDRALVDAHSFVLYYGARSFTVIPKRVFETAEQLAAFRRLIELKIPEILKKNS